MSAGRKQAIQPADIAAMNKWRATHFKPPLPPFDPVAIASRGGDVMREIIHPQTSSSLVAMLQFMIEALKRTVPVRALLADLFVLNVLLIKVYLPVYLVPMLLFRSKQLLRDPATVLSSTALGIARSSVFLSVYCGIGWSTICYLKGLFGPTPWLGVRALACCAYSLNC